MDSAAFRHRQATQKSLLDFVMEDARSLQRNLTNRDKGKLDEYLTSIREIEERITRAERDLLKEQLNKFKRQLFVAKSEASAGHQKDMFFNEAESLGSQAEPAAEEPVGGSEDDKIDVPGHKRAKRGRKPLDAATFADTLGTLEITDTATIHLESGAALAFADSSTIDWTSGTLNINGGLYYQ